MPSNKFVTLIAASILLAAPASAVRANGAVDMDATARAPQAWNFSSPGPLATFGASLLLGSLAIASQGLKRR